MAAGDPLPSALPLATTIPQEAEERRIALFLDFDGTLSPIVARPDDASISEDMRAAVAAVGAPCAVAVVSGRTLEDVRERVGLTTVAYAGSHGLDFRAVDGEEWHHPDAPAFLDELGAAEAELRKQLVPFEGVEVEGKRYSVAVHYRRANAAELPAVEYAVRGVLDAHPRLQELPGKMVHDIRPALPWDKGESVLRMIERLGGVRAVLPVYIGDDRTDEDAFAVLDGIGAAIVVRDVAAPTRATHVLAGPSEVQAFLERLASALPRSAA